MWKSGIGLLAVALVTVSPVTERQETSATEIRRTGELPPELREASGLAVSRQFPGIIWIHNDSGHGPWIYATRLDGEVVARFLVVDAQSVDWEDIAVGPCLSLRDGEACLFIADTGDNDGRRSELSIFVVPEPNPLSPHRQTEPARQIRFRPVRGPTDIEALAVTPEGDVLMLSKGTRGAVHIFRVQRTVLRIAAETGQTVSVRSSGRLPMGPIRTLAQMVTGAAWAPDGTRLVVRTYQSLHFYRSLGQDLVPDGPSCRIGSVEAQGEAVDFRESGDFVTVSEGLNDTAATVYWIRC